MPARLVRQALKDEFGASPSCFATICALYHTTKHTVSIIRAVCDDDILKNVFPSEYANPLIQHRSKPLCEMRVHLMMTICPKPLRIACLSVEFGLTMDAILRRCLAKK